MAAAFLLLLPEGVLAASAAAGKAKQRGRALRLHLRLQLGALALAMLGFAAIFASRLRAGKAHFTTAHAWLGVATLAATQLLGFAGLLLYFGLPKPYAKLRRRLATIHRAVLASAPRFARMQAGKLLPLLAIVTVLAALKFWDPGHKRHKGLLTYTATALLFSLGLSLQLLLAERSSSWRAAIVEARKGEGSATTTVSISNQAAAVEDEAND
eukprot:SM000072S21241  [mRNA]  locus=s72:633105:634241:- [translate_table: standard]